MEDKNVESRDGDMKHAHRNESETHSLKNVVSAPDLELASPAEDAAEIEKVERVYRKIDKRIIPRKQA